MQRKAQAAMEFLMTYGWALLVVLIAIAALAFFGVLNPSKFLPTQCVLGPGFACEDFKINSVSLQLKLFVRNGMGQDFDFFTIHVDKKSPNGVETCGGMAGFGAGAIGGGINRNEFFRDGEVKQMINANPNIGIICDPSMRNPTGTNTPNCCNDFGTYFAPPIQLCPLTTNCMVSTGLKQGSKFSEDLIISYRSVGSQIMHQRIGKLVSQVE